MSAHSRQGHIIRERHRYRSLSLLCLLLLMILSPRFICASPATLNAHNDQALPPLTWETWTLSRLSRVDTATLNQLSGLAFFDPTTSLTSLLPWVAAGGRLLVAFELRSQQSCGQLLKHFSLTLSSPAPSERESFTSFSGIHALWWKKSSALPELSETPWNQPLLSNVPVVFQAPSALAGRPLRPVAVFEAEQAAGLHFYYGRGQVLFFADATALSDLMSPLPTNRRLIEELRAWLSHEGEAAYGDPSTVLDFKEEELNAPLRFLLGELRSFSTKMAHLNLSSFVRLCLRLAALSFIFRCTVRLFMRRRATLESEEVS